MNGRGRVIAPDIHDICYASTQKKAFFHSIKNTEAHDNFLFIAETDIVATRTFYTTTPSPVPPRPATHITAPTLAPEIGQCGGGGGGWGPCLFPFRFQRPRMRCGMLRLVEHQTYVRGNPTAAAAAAQPPTPHPPRRHHPGQNAGQTRAVAVADGVAAAAAAALPQWQTALLFVCSVLRATGFLLIIMRWGWGR